MKCHGTWIRVECREVLRHVRVGVPNASQAVAPPGGGGSTTTVYAFDDRPDCTVACKCTLLLDCLICIFTQRQEQSNAQAWVEEVGGVATSVRRGLGWPFDMASKWTAVTTCL